MNADELHQALLAETEPRPGLADRAFTDFPPPDGSRRWVLGVAAAALTVCMVAALAAAGGRLGWLQLPGVSAGPQPAPVPTGPALPGRLGGVAPTDVVAVTPSGAVWIQRAEVPGRPVVALYESVDGGARWVKRLVYSAVDMAPGRRMWIDADGRGLLVAPESLYETSDAGAHWVKEPLPASIGKVTWVQVLNGHEAMAIGTDGTSPHSEVVLARTDDGGRFWTVQASIDPMQAFGQNMLCEAVKGCRSMSPMMFADSRHGIVLGAPGPRSRSGVYVTLDGGVTWQPAALPASVDPTHGMNVVVGADGDDIAFITYDRPVNHLYASTDGGRHWSPARSIPADFGFLGTDRLVVVDDSHWWAGTDRGVCSSPDQGLHWYPAAPLPRYTSQVDQIGFSDPQHGWVLVELAAGPPTGPASPARSSGPLRVAMFTTADGGHSWQQVPLP